MTLVQLPEHAILQLLQGHLSAGCLVIEADFTPDTKCNRRACLANMAVGRDIGLITLIYMLVMVCCKTSRSILPKPSLLIY